MIDGSGKILEVYGMKKGGIRSAHDRSLSAAAFLILCLSALSPALRGEESKVMSPAEIHSMPRAEAALARPVKVRGVVTFSYPNSVGEFVLGDASGGVYVTTNSPDWTGSLPTVGSLVDVTGVTAAGGYAPVVSARSVKILGNADLPVARPVTANQLLTGRFDSRRVEVRGVVRQVIHRNHIESFAMELAGEIGVVTVFALESGGLTSADLVDAEVMVWGVCFPFFNERAQVSGVRLEITNAREIAIIRPPPADPFATPLVRLDQLQPYSPDGINFHRQRIRGTVTFVNLGNYLYLQDGNHAVRVNLAENQLLAIGDEVEAVGFPEVRTRFVEWQQAILRKIGIAPIPAPIPISTNEVFFPDTKIEDRAHNDWDGRLVSLTGHLEKVEKLADNSRLLLMDWDGHAITVLLAGADGGATIDSLRPGSKISATGICVVEYSHTWPTPDYADATGVSLLLRHSRDVHVIEAASWWTSLRLRFALAAILVILLASLAWAKSLRREVIRRTAALASETRARRDAEVEFDATLRERERMSVDLHDTVEQALTGLSYQLVVSEALYESEPQRSMQHFELAKQLLAQSREEVRRSVWNLRAQALNGRHLADVLRDVAAGLSTRNPVLTRVSVIGEEDGLPDFIAGHLLLLAQESMTNAIKHGKPKKIDITLEFDETSVELRIQDDGGGFDPSHAPGLAEGHLGLQGMRERMKRLGGVVKVESSPGQGTTIRARVPLPE